MKAIVIPNGPVVREWRQKSALRSQESLAERAGISKRTLERIESSRPTQLENLELVAQALGISINSIIDQAGSDSRSHLTTLDMPTQFVGREQQLNEISRLLLQTLSESPHPLVLIGVPGVGKTTLSRAIQGHEQLKRRYGDRILFASLGDQPNYFEVLDRWNRQLRGDLLNPQLTPASLREEVNRTVGQSSCLFVLDDVWDSTHAKFLLLGGGQCRSFITSRRPAVPDQLTTSHNIIILKGLTKEASIVLLTGLCGAYVTEHRREFEAFAEAVEGLPLALQVAGRMVNREIRRSGDPTTLFADLHDLTRLLTEPPPPEMCVQIHELKTETSNVTVAQILMKSVSTLSVNARKCFAALGYVKPKPACFNNKYLQRIWPAGNNENILNELEQSGLIEIVGKDQYQMHALLRAFARDMNSNEK